MRSPRRKRARGHGASLICRTSMSLESVTASGLKVDGREPAATRGCAAGLRGPTQSMPRTCSTLSSSQGDLTDAGRSAEWAELFDALALYPKLSELIVALPG